MFTTRAAGARPTQPPRPGRTAKPSRLSYFWNRRRSTRALRTSTRCFR
ncbi:MAG: hypothetical protein WKG07_19150 [Hymenobacter sp.]